MPAYGGRPEPTDVPPDAGLAGEDAAARGAQRGRYTRCEGKMVPVSGGGVQWYHVRELGQVDPGWIAIDPDDTVPIER